ncbi:hypothetical protein BJ742DRAFT_133831 [Cladochytrium replicatum]|nr:hypothetical protein BJ742DRAFT_133831 [Cladochytrium replicatum]
MAVRQLTFIMSPLSTALISTASSAFGFLLPAAFVASIYVCLPEDAELRLSALLRSRALWQSRMSEQSNLPPLTSTIHVRHTCSTQTL